MKLVIARSVYDLQPGMPRNESSSGGSNNVVPMIDIAMPLGRPLLRLNAIEVLGWPVPTVVSVGVPLLPGQPSPCEETRAISMLTSTLLAARPEVPVAGGDPAAAVQ